MQDKPSIFGFNFRLLLILFGLKYCHPNFDLIEFSLNWLSMERLKSNLILV